MTRSMSLNVRLGGTLSEFVTRNVGEDGDYDSVSEYVRDLIRRDKAQKEQEGFERLKAELRRAFSAPDDSYVAISADDVLNDPDARQR